MGRDRATNVFVLGIVLIFFGGLSPAHAVASRCLALAGLDVPVVQASLQDTALKPNEVGLTFVGHSTFRIESPKGIVVATDFAGLAGDGPVPDVVTMNHAHETHYTNVPDPAIKHVLRGWGEAGKPADHNLTLEDVYIRNVPTNIRHWSGQTERDGNSVFIIEVSGLCIGHLGHLHHQLTPQHIGWIGRLDVVLVPVDGTYTLDHTAMIQVVKDLRASIVIPMHFFGPSTLASFIAKLGKEFEVEISDTPSVTISEATLPASPKVLVLPGF